MKVYILSEIELYEESRAIKNIIAPVAFSTLSEAESFFAWRVDEIEAEGGFVEDGRYLSIRMNNGHGTVHMIDIALSDLY